MTEQSFTERFIKARRDAIALDFAHLNDMQRAAVLTTEGPLLLLAGAGSGKTTVLINRMSNLIKFGRGADSDEIPEFATEQELRFLEHYAKNPVAEDAARARSLCTIDPVEPWRLIAITFTNKAAEELKIRLERMLGEGAGDIWAMTFHSACVRILRRDIDRLGFDRGFTIYGLVGQPVTHEAHPQGTGHGRQDLPAPHPPRHHQPRERRDGFRGSVLRRCRQER